MISGVHFLDVLSGFYEIQMTDLSKRAFWTTKQQQSFQPYQGKILKLCSATSANNNLWYTIPAYSLIFRIYRKGLALQDCVFLVKHHIILSSRKRNYYCITARPKSLFFLTKRDFDSGPHSRFAWKPSHQTSGASSLLMKFRPDGFHMFRLGEMMHRSEFSNTVL